MAASARHWTVDGRTTDGRLNDTRASGRRTFSVSLSCLFVLAAVDISCYDSAVHHFADVLGEDCRFVRLQLGDLDLLERWTKYVKRLKRDRVNKLGNLPATWQMMPNACSAIRRVQWAKS